MGANRKRALVWPEADCLLFTLALAKADAEDGQRVGGPDPSRGSSNLKPGCGNLDPTCGLTLWGVRDREAQRAAPTRVVPQRHSERPVL